MSDNAQPISPLPEPTFPDEKERELLIKEMGELHQYTRSLFDFEAKWNLGLWVSNGVAGGWLETVAMPIGLKMTTCLIFATFNVCAMCGNGVAIDRLRSYSKRLRIIATEIGPIGSRLRPNLPAKQLIGALGALRWVSALIVLVWVGMGFYKMSLMK